MHNSSLHSIRMVTEEQELNLKTCFVDCCKFCQVETSAVNVNHSVCSHFNPLLNSLLFTALLKLLLVSMQDCRTMLSTGQRFRAIHFDGCLWGKLGVVVSRVFV